MRQRADVTVDMTLQMIGEVGIGLPARLRYLAEDPFAVRLIFGPDGGTETVEWTFARELLAAGLTAAAGAGDVRIAPHSEQAVTLRLCSPSGRASLRMPRAEVSEFLLRTYALVWPGQESQHLDLDDTVEALLHAGLS